MRNRAEALDKVAKALLECIDAYNELRDYVNEYFSPEDYVLWNKELNTLKEIQKQIQANCNKWANEIIIELTINLEEIVKMKKT